MTQQVLDRSVTETSEWLDEARCLTLVQSVGRSSFIHLVGLVTASRPMYIVMELASHGSLKDCLRRYSDTVFADAQTLLQVCLQVVNITNCLLCVKTQSVHHHSALLILQDVCILC